MDKRIKKMVFAGAAVYAAAELISALGRVTSGKNNDIDALFPDAADEIKSKIEEVKNKEKD